MLVDLTGQMLTEADEATINRVANAELEYQAGMMGMFCNEAGLNRSATMIEVIENARTANFSNSLRAMREMYGSVEAIVFPTRTPEASAADEASDSGYQALARRLDGQDLLVYVWGNGKLAIVK